MKTFRAGALVAFLAPALVACGPRSVVQAELEIDGQCALCPAQRLDSLLRALPGVCEAALDPARGLLTLRYDTLAINEAQIAEVINDAGYDVGSYLADELADPDPCCQGGEADMGMDEEWQEDDELAELDSAGVSPDSALQMFLEQMVLGGAAAGWEDAGPAPADELDLEEVEEETPR